MLANSFSITSYTGRPNFAHSCKLENIFETVLVEAVPWFIQGLEKISRTKKTDEGDLSQEFVAEINKCLIREPRGILAVAEYKDVYTIGANPSKRVDLAFVSSEQGSSKVKLYTVEAKRLPTGTGNREREYVYGFFNSGSPSGGIQRFKTGDHGYELSRSGLVGYVEENDFTHWYTTINGWIKANAANLPEWGDEEQLQDINIDSAQNCSISHSIANRATDAINLFHLWIKIPFGKF